jgi:subtilisin family serine protease
MGASVMSNSWAVSAAWGEPGHDQPGFSPALRDAILAANAAGVLFVAAAGNSTLDLDQQVLFPASYNLDNTITVAATDPQDQMVSWSNYGELTVELGAPGYSIRSTVPAVCRIFGPPPTTRNCDGTGYLVASGTSMAAPHVAAVLGLMRARFPGVSHLVLKEALLASTDPLPSLAGVTVSGGRLNAASALNAVPTATDSDGDGVPNDVDNCLTVPNPGQDDSDGDLCGNRCDADYNQDSLMSILDFGAFRSCFTGAVQEVCDHAPETLDGFISIQDFGIFRQQFVAGVPGPGQSAACDGQ